MADMFDCGRHTRKTWREGSESQARWLGPYDQDMTAATANQILEHDEKLTPEACAMFARGWEADAAEVATLVR